MIVTAVRLTTTAIREIVLMHAQPQNRKSMSTIFPPSDKATHCQLSNSALLSYVVSLSIIGVDSQPLILFDEFCLGVAPAQSGERNALMSRKKVREFDNKTNQLFSSHVVFFPRQQKYESMSKSVDFGSPSQPNVPFPHASTLPHISFSGTLISPQPCASGQLHKGRLTVIVVGGGLAGVCAAIEAHRQGCDVVLVEKEASLGGNSNKATSGINGVGTRFQSPTPNDGESDDVDLFIKDTLASGGGLSDVNKVTTLAHNANSAIEFLSSFGLDLSNVVQLGGHSVPRTHRIPPLEDGRPRPVGFTIMKSLTEAVSNLTQQSERSQELEGEVTPSPTFKVMTGTKFKSLLVGSSISSPPSSTPGHGITGVKVEDSNGMEIDLKGRVILAAGGFAYDRPKVVHSDLPTDTSLLNLYAPSISHYSTTNGPWATGDVIKAIKHFDGDQLRHIPPVQTPQIPVPPQHPPSMGPFASPTGPPPSHYNMYTSPSGCFPPQPPSFAGQYGAPPFYGHPPLHPYGHPPHHPYGYPQPPYSLNQPPHVNYSHYPPHAPRDPFAPPPYEADLPPPAAAPRPPPLQPAVSLIDMSKVQVHPTGFVDPHNPVSTTKILAPEALRACGAILVNQKGERFANELGRRDYLTDKIINRCERFKLAETTEAEMGPVTAIMVLNEEMINKFGHGGAQFYITKGLMTTVGVIGDGTGVDDIDSSASIGGVGGLNGVPVRALRRAIEKYSQIKSWAKEKKEVKDEFGKSVFPIHFNLKIDSIYLAFVSPCVHYCMGGIEIDERARVVGWLLPQPHPPPGSLPPPHLQSQTHPPLPPFPRGLLPGLYAAGEVSGGVHGENRLGGNSLLECVVFGRVAGASAATDDDFQGCQRSE
eukprot:GHVN01090279.1.p1 GENE.GHVN01090279.1~~GHVN01090279.1.p1  ORF type:complete len:873 (-),score=165.53 GHVN01090279.1:703-3321(-)